jgi:hypothetical protein
MNERRKEEKKEERKEGRRKEGRTLLHKRRKDNIKGGRKNRINEGYKGRPI